ncbi:MAG: hypothetical protein ABIN01_09445 [Ferruginibacter sp.]
MEKISVKKRVNPNADGKYLNSSDKKNSTLPMSKAFSSAVRTHTVKLINIDLKNII